eukprot:4905502-Prymnesium_polylepis.1
MRAFVLRCPLRPPVRPAVGDCQSTSELTAKSAERPPRRALAVRNRRTIGQGRAVQPDMRCTP